MWQFLIKKTKFLSNTKLIMQRQLHLLRQQAFVNGEWIPANNNKFFEVINPSTGATITTVPDMNIDDVSNAIDAASKAFNTWQDTTPKQRSDLLRNWFNLLKKHQNDLADIVTEESGKPITEAKGEVNYGNSFVEFYSEEARRIDGEIISSTDRSKKYLIEKQPIGVVGLITPWNFPHAMMTRKASAALAAGCTCVIKPAEDTPLTTLALAQLAKDAGIPDGVINVITCDRPNAPIIGNLLCTSPSIAGISFTGSTEVGKLLYKQCSNGIKRLGLELGGNAPFIVFESANIERAIKCAMTSKFRNCGQTCVASNRFLIQDNIYDEFVSKIVKEVEQLRIGDGKCDTNQIGPLINQAQFDKVSNLINDAVSKGATVLTGAKPLTNLGPLFYSPTVLGDIQDNMKVYKEEIFGPCINLIRFKDENEALQIANSTNRGLAGYIFTENIQQIFRVTKHLQVGMCGVNEGLISAAEAPFGGVKESGLGREGSHHGIDDFTYIKIQQIDGGFFEKFGSLFRETVELAERNENAEKEKVAEEAAEQIQSTDNEDQNECKVIDENSDNENVSTASDSESDEQKDHIDFISTALNIEELYVEVLYEILHNVGCEVNYEIGQTALFNYVQDAFKLPNNKHQQLLEIAEKKEPPEILLYVEVMEAKDLSPKDSNGLSDPFVTLYLTNNSAHRYNTSVKPATLTPVWEEHFALPISEDISEETLCLEVWDFDPAETVKEKLGKIFDVKGVKGVRKLVKEIAVTAATGQHENELIGIAKIPLKTIPASGMTMWYSLDKKNKANRQGVLKIRVGFSSEKNNQVAAQEHRHLLQIVLLHEIEMSKVAPYWWSGTFSAQADTLLTQHIAQSGLNPTIVALCQWSVYTIIHNNHPLSFTLFTNLLEKLLKPLQIVNGLCEEDVRLFWDATKRLLPSCFSILRKIRKKNGCKDKAIMKQIVEVLNIIKKIQTLEIPNNFELFPKNLYPWLTYNDGIVCDINSVINDAIIQGATDWFNHILENNMKHDDSDTGRSQNLIQIIQLIRSDLQKAIEFYDKLFQECVNFQYAKALYTFYQAKISTLAEPDILTICKSLKKLQFTGNTINQIDSDRTLTEGTLLFELYLAIQRFVLLGQGLCPLDYDTFHIKNFYQWFYGGVTQWLDIALFKALQRIEKAVDLDNLIPVDMNVKYSSSAVDTLTIFYQVKVFWQQLNWPDVEGCYTFIAKIIDDICCRCCVFYAGKMSDKVDGMGVDKDDRKFQVTEEWCLAINNIEYVRQSLQPFTNELGMEEVIKKISELKSPLEAQRCQHTLDNVIMNSIDTVRNEIIELLETVVSKMSPAMKRLLIEGAELYDQDNNSVDRLMMYVDNNLRTLHNELNEENFDRVLEIVWENLSIILNNIIQSNIEQRRPPSFFANLRKTLELMVGSFKAPDQYCDNLKRTDQLLKFNGLETCDLIHQIHLDLHEKFNTIENSPYGEISIRTKFDRDNKLKIAIMNARNLIAMDSNGSCDSFVRVHLLPEERFTAISKPKTQTHNKNQFPLYDETFVLQLTQEQRNLSNGLVLFSVKDKDLLGYNNQYIGEAFIHFKDIPQTDDDISELPQIHLQLGRPDNLTTDSIKCLEHRQGDKLAKEFLRKLKQRMNPS